MTDVYATLQIGRTDRPVGILNTNGFYDPLLLFFDRMRGEGFLSARYNGMFIVRSTAESLLAAGMI